MPRREDAKKIRRVSNILCFDGHASWQNARRMTLDDRREQRP